MTKDTRRHHQYDAMLNGGGPQPPVPVLRDEDPDFPPQKWTQTDALLSEALRQLYAARCEIAEMHETLRKMRAETEPRVLQFPASALRNGTPR